LIAPATASAVNQVTFSQVGNLTSPRQLPGAAPLPDGRILVVGGYSGLNGNQGLDSAETFDPKTNTFTAIGSTMAIGRYAPAVAPLPDGRILVAGGWDNGNHLASAEVFNPSSETFSPVGSMATVREDAGAAPLPDGRVLIIGGYSNTGAVDSTEIFDPKTNTFSPGPTLPYPTYYSAVAVISGGRILIAGGFDGSTMDFTDKAVVFNPSSGTFTSVGSLPTRTNGPSGASLPGGRALVAGGYDDNASEFTTRAQAFDPATSSFSSTGIGNLVHPRQEAASAELPDGRVLVAGGYFASPAQRLDTAEVLSVPSNSFTSKLKGRKVKFTVTNEGVAQVTDVSTQVATTAKKKKKRPKLVKTTSKHGGPGTIVVKIRLTKQGSAKLRQKGKLRVRVVYTPDQGLAATKKLKLKAGK
jgi:hypothetical protein